MLVPPLLIAARSQDKVLIPYEAAVSAGTFVCFVAYQTAAAREEGEWQGKIR